MAKTTASRNISDIGGLADVIKQVLLEMIANGEVQGDDLSHITLESHLKSPESVFEEVAQSFKEDVGDSYNDDADDAADALAYKVASAKGDEDLRPTVAQLKEQEESNISIKEESVCSDNSRLKDESEPACSPKTSQDESELRGKNQTVSGMLPATPFATPSDATKENQYLRRKVEMLVDASKRKGKEQAHLESLLSAKKREIEQLNNENSRLSKDICRLVKELDLSKEKIAKQRDELSRLNTKQKGSRSKKICSQEEQCNPSLDSGFEAYTALCEKVESLEARLKEQHSESSMAKRGDRGVGERDWAKSLLEAQRGEMSKISNELTKLNRNIVDLTRENHRILEEHNKALKRRDNNDCKIIELLKEGIVREKQNDIKQVFPQSPASVPFNRITVNATLYVDCFRTGRLDATYNVLLFIPPSGSSNINGMFGKITLAKAARNTSDELVFFTN